MNAQVQPFVPQTNHVVHLLETAFRMGVFRSLREGHLRNMLDYGDNTFARMVRESSRGAAEAAMSIEEMFNRKKDYANAIANVASGLLSLARTDRQGSKVRTLSGKEKQDCQLNSFKSGTVPVVSFINDSEILARGRVGVGEARDVRVWGPKGVLGLQAVLLRVGQNTIAEDYSKPHGTKLGLVFRLPESKLANQNGFAVLEVNCVGDLQGELRRPRPILAQSFFNAQLGLEGAESLNQCSNQLVDSVEEVLGFPGCNNFLADNLPGLERYLTAIAHMR